MRRLLQKGAGKSIVAAIMVDVRLGEKSHCGSQAHLKTGHCAVRAFINLKSIPTFTNGLLYAAVGGHFLCLLALFGIGKDTDRSY